MKAKKKIHKVQIWAEVRRTGEGRIFPQEISKKIIKIRK